MHKKMLFAMGMPLTVALFTTFYLYYLGSNIPIRFRGATVCKAYRVEKRGDLICDWTSQHYSTLNQTPPPSYFRSFKQLVPGEYITKGPVACHGSVLADVNQLVEDPKVYLPRDRFQKSRFSPRYVYRLAGSSGTLMIFIDTASGWSSVQRYDRNGVCVENSGIRQCFNAWTSVLKETFPSDKFTGR
jgi:hypothetical protein